MPFLERDGLNLHFIDFHDGVPFVFQHGLGGDVNQPLGLFAPPEGLRLISMDFRGHGLTSAIGPEDRLRFDVFADDLIALFDYLEIERSFVGGISMGAGVALNAAVRYPGRVRGLVLSRPAWLDAPRPENLRYFALIAQFLRQHGAVEGLERFRASRVHEQIERTSGDAVQSLENQFKRTQALERVAVLEHLPTDAPVRDRSLWAGIAVPALVLGNSLDPIHPLGYARVLADAIPGANFKEITPKSTSLERHASDVQAALLDFFEHQLTGR